MVKPYLLLVFAACALSGCSFGERVVGFVYQTNWGPGPTGESQKVELLPITGGASFTQIINNAGPGQQTLLIPGVPAGFYEIQVTLYESPNASGNVLGVIRDFIAIGSTNHGYRTQRTLPPTQLDLKPRNAEIRVQGTQQFYAVARTGSGDSVFIPPDGILWESLNPSVASVSQSGIAAGVSEGTATIRASYSGLSDTSTLRVEAFTITHAKWTVIVYMNASNDLDQYSDLNVNQMERVAGNSQVRFVVQWKRARSLGYGAPWTGTRRYLIKPDSDSQNISWGGVKSELVQDLGEGVDMGSKDTLRDFISWTQTYFPADRYILVVWNHGSGWRLSPQGGTRGVSFDDEFGSHIETWELADALQAPEPIEIISWDASLMQMLEVAYEIRNRCSLIVGSEESPPASGLPYHLVFRSLKDNPNQSSENFSASFGEGMLQYYGSSAPIQQSVLLASKMPDLAIAVDGLGVQLTAHKGLIESEVIEARNETKRYGAGFGRVYLDLWDLCDNVAKRTTVHTKIPEACEAVQEQLEQTVLHEHHNSLSALSHGISIEFGNRDALYWKDYRRLAFAMDTNWDEWLALAP